MAYYVKRNFAEPTHARTHSAYTQGIFLVPAPGGRAYIPRGWQYIPGICQVYTPQFGLSIYRPYIQRFARNYFLLISTSSLKNSRTGAHFYPNRKTGKKFKRMPKKQPPPNTNAIKTAALPPHIAPGTGEQYRPRRILS